ncbi:hypothetical protein [Catenulispora rubra]|uniref:hypothetical protein n=1 Tax=Catenulispora rubra TaxID=280293 RepID=UPI001892764B|nr:hypothetical protein [Catenulispora rubra]
MAIHSAWLALTGQSRVDTRLATSVGVVPAGVLTSRSGVVPDGGFGLQLVAAMQCQIMPGRAFVQGVAAQGGYQVASDAPVVLTVPDGDPQYNRIDVIALEIQDQQFDTSGQTQAIVVLIKGTPAATPVAPVVPPAAIGLFQISVPSKTSAGTSGVAWSTAVTDLRVYTSGLGGIVPAGTTPWTPPMAGQYADLNGELQRWSGAAWTPVYDPMASGGNLPPVTSTTRPSNAPAGKLVYETDSGAVALWNGTNWRHQPGLIAAQTVATATPSITFSAIPQVYRDLRLVICAKSDGTVNTGWDSATMRFNGAVDTQYNWNSYWVAQSATSVSVASKYGDTSMQCAEIWNSSYSTQGRGIATIDIPNYADTNNLKVFSSVSSATDCGTVGILQTYGGGHASLGAITSITISMNVGNFVPDSTFTLYGLG